MLVWILNTYLAALLGAYYHPQINHILINFSVNNFLIIVVYVLNFTTATNCLYSNFKLFFLTDGTKANWNKWKYIYLLKTELWIGPKL